MPHNTLSVVIRQVVGAIYEEYKEEVWTLPSTPAEWKDVAKQFESRWNFHHCVGAIDGKHVRIVKPKKSGGDYYNYKGWHSIVLLAVANANYEFIWCNVGSPGKSSDAGIFNRSSLRPSLENNTLGLPPPEPLPLDNKPVGYFIVGDEAFPLQPWMMKKYPNRNVTHAERIFNYRSSRARLVVENSFGILTNRWRCLTTTMMQEPKNVTKIVLGALTLHNVLRRRMPLRPGEVDADDGQGNIVPGAWRQTAVLTDNRNLRGNQSMRRAKEQRNDLKDYYNNVGRVRWQERAVAVVRQRQQQVPPVDPQTDSESESDMDTD